MALSVLKDLFRWGDRWVASLDSVSLSLLLVAGTLSLLLVAYLLWRLRPRLTRLRHTAGRKASWQYRFAWSAELFVLLVLLLGALAWGLFVPAPVGLRGASQVIWVGGMERLPFDAVPAVAASFGVLAGVVLLSRIRMQAALFLFLSAVWTVLCAYGLLRASFLPLIEQIRAEAAVDPFVRELLPGVMLPGMPLQVARLLLWALGCVLCGVYFVRRGFAWWKFALGSLLGGWLVALAVMPVLLTQNGWLFLQPLAFTLVAAAMVGLPFQRAALERLFGVSFRYAPQQEFARHGLVAVGLGHAAVVLMVIALGGLAVAGHADRRLMRLIVHGPPEVYHEPSARNAYPILKRLFLKRPATGTLPEAFSQVVFMSNGAFSHIQDEEGWKKYDTPELREGLRQIAPYFDTFTTASQCDYFQQPRYSPGLAFLPVRETARALHTRAMVAVRDGNTSAAVRDMDAILGFGALLKRYPSMVGQMIGSAVRGIAADAIYQFYTVLRHDPAAMDLLARMLEQQRENLGVLLDIEALRRGEPCMGEVATNVELAMPAFLRASMNLRGQAVQLQQMQLAVALERYKDRYGRYPAALTDLVPEFLQRLPLDPFQGKLYAYALQGEDFTLKMDGYEVPVPFTPALKFPPPPPPRPGEAKKEK